MENTAWQLPWCSSLRKRSDALASSLQLSDSKSGCISAGLSPPVFPVPGSPGGLALHKHLIRINIRLAAAPFSPCPGGAPTANPRIPECRGIILSLTAAPLLQAVALWSGPMWSKSGQLAPPVTGHKGSPLLWPPALAQTSWHPSYHIFIHGKPTVCQALCWAPRIERGVSQDPFLELTKLRDTY